MKKKKYGLILILILLNVNITNKILAKETIELKNDSTIKYKWYILEKSEGIYYPRGEELSGYIEDLNNIQYGKYSSISEAYCNYSKEKYKIKEYINKIYQRVINFKYIKLQNFNYKGQTIEIYSNLVKVPYKIISNNGKELILELNKSIDPGNAFFYIEYNLPYDIWLSENLDFSRISLMYHNELSPILIPNKKWICDKTIKINEVSSHDIPENDFCNIYRIRRSCQVQEIKTYRYKLKKKYYDSKYHQNIPNYIPDLEDYIIEYKGELPFHTIEVVKTEKEYIPKREFVPITKYIYLSPEPPETNKNMDSNNEESSHIKYIEKEIIKKIKVIPKKAYIVMLVCIFIIILEFIFLIKKSRLK